MESMADSSEKLRMLSPRRKSCKLTLFEDLLQDDTGIPDSGASYGDDSCPSDSESGVSGTEQNAPPPPIRQSSDNGLIRIGSGEMIHQTIGKKLVSSLSVYGFGSAQIHDIYRRDYAGIMSRAKLHSFSIFTRATEMKRAGNANVKYAWYGASKDEVSRILSHGFSFPANNSPLFGHGVCLSPADHPEESVVSLPVDEDGLRYMLLCRVLLGKTEAVRPGSGQHNPSSDEFDSGVDNLASPRKYIVWSSRMNTHILPEFVVSFRATTSCKGCRHSLQTPRMPNSHWMPFSTLISALSRFLPCDAVTLISKYHNDYKKKKISRYDMIQKVRNIAGDKLLMSIIKSQRGK